MLDAGVPVGLGVDGSASNDGAQMVAEARQALLLARVGRSLEPFGCDHGPAEMTARDVLALAGDARLVFHGIDRIRPGSSDLVPGGGRVNLTLRVAGA